MVDWRAHDYVLMAVGLIKFAAPRVVKFNIGLELHAEYTRGLPFSAGVGTRRHCR